MPYPVCAVILVCLLTLSSAWGATAVGSDKGLEILLNVINDALNYSTIAAGKMELEDININLEQLCLECASVFFVSAERANNAIAR